MSGPSYSIDMSITDTESKVLDVEAFFYEW